MPVHVQRACDSNFNTPLHFLLYNRYVPHVLDTTIFPKIKMDSRFDPQPMDIRKQDAIDCLLHESANMSFVEFLVEQWPECVSIENNNAQTPLDLAVTSYCQLDVIKFLHRKNKALLHHIGYNGNTILHNVSARIDIKHIMRKFNRHTTTGIILNLDKDSLFETLCFDSRDRTEVFMWIYSACEYLACKKNLQNQFPVHIATANHAEYGIIQKLVNKYGKECLNKSDAYHNTPVQSMLSCEMGALHTHDKIIKHLVHEQVIQPERVMQYMKDAIWSGQVEVDELLLVNILRKEEFTNEIIRYIIPTASIENLMHKATGIWAILEHLKNAILDHAVSSHVHVYISYYKNILEAIPLIFMDLRGLNCGDNNTLAHLERSHSMCSKHLDALASKFPNDTDKFLGIKACLSNVLTRIESILDETKMNEIADMNAMHLIAEEEEDASESHNTAIKKRQNRSKRGLHPKRLIDQEITEIILQHEHDNLKKLYQSLQTQHDALERKHLELEQQYQKNVLEKNAIYAKHKTHLQDTQTLNQELKNIKQQHKTSQKRNKRLHEKITMQKKMRLKLLTTHRLNLSKCYTSKIQSLHMHVLSVGTRQYFVGSGFTRANMY